MTDSLMSPGEISQKPPTDGIPLRRILVVLFVIAAIIRGLNVWRPIDDSSQNLWREPDVGGIARNYYREGMNLFYPRIDWRGNGPGYVESEFPLYPWMVAWLYQLFGYHEELARVVSLIMSLASFLIFLRISLLLLPPIGVIIAAVFFAFNPLAVKLATAVQPEPLMFLASLIAVYSFLAWCKHEKKTQFYVSFLATTLAILAKLPAAHLGLLFAALAVDKFGRRAFLRKDLWLFAAGSVGVSALWYIHAGNLYKLYGNSLGMSNEAYLRILSLNFLAAAGSTVPGILKIEIRDVWTLPGLALGLFGLLRAIRHRPYRVLAYWTGALVVLFFITGRTTGEAWARYYHIVSVPPAALLIGLGFTSLSTFTLNARLWTVFTHAALTSSVLLFAFANLTSSGTNLLSTLPARLALLFVFSGVGMVLTLVMARRSGTIRDDNPSFRDIIPFAAAAILLTLFSAALLFEARLLRSELRANHGSPLFACAKSFAAHVPTGSLIIASAIAELDQHGLPRAYNAPYMFYWMDRKGFSIPDSGQNLDYLRALQAQGARLYVAEKPHLSLQPDFERQLRSRFDVLAECEAAILYDLRPRASHSIATARPHST